MFLGVFTVIFILPPFFISEKKQFTLAKYLRNKMAGMEGHTNLINVFSLIQIYLLLRPLQMDLANAIFSVVRW